MSSEESLKEWKCPACHKDAGGVTSMPSKESGILWTCKACKRVFSLKDVLKYNKYAGDNGKQS